MPVLVLTIVFIKLPLFTIPSHPQNMAATVRDIKAADFIQKVTSTTMPVVQQQQLHYDHFLPALLYVPLPHPPPSSPSVFGTFEEDGQGAASLPISLPSPLERRAPRVTRHRFPSQNGLTLLRPPLLTSLLLMMRTGARWRRSFIVPRVTRDVWPSGSTFAWRPLPARFT